MPQYQGIWTLAQAAQLQSTQRWATDPLFENTTLLLQADNAANGAQNNTFLDSSSNNFTITRNGNTTQGSFTPFSQSPGWWGNYFNGSSNLNLSTQAVLNVGTGNFTFECFAYFPNVSSSYSRNQVFGATEATASSALIVELSGATQGSNGIKVSICGTTVITYTTAIPPNTWHHIAVVREGTGSNQVKLYVNGTNVASGTGTGSLGTPNYNIGRLQANNSAFDDYYTGYLSNIRITNAALYTGNFTPSTTPLTTTVSAGTVSLLTCQSNRFVDNSTNNFTLTVNGSPSVQAFSPFAPQYQYTPSVTGGSGYFDGTGDYLSSATSIDLQLGSSNFSLEWWEYRTAANNVDTAIVCGDGTFSALLGYYNSGAVRFYLSTTGSSWNVFSDTSAGTTASNSWNHFVLTRSGTAFRVFLNGVLGAYATGSGSVTQSTNQIFISGGINGSSVPIEGYMSGVRFVKGSIPTSYQTSSTTTNTPIFTPPTAPVTTTSQGATSGDVKYLVNFTNAGIYDGTMKNNLETVGNAQISTAIVKYGTGSMYFDGNGDNLAAPANNDLNFGTGDFTVEFWAYIVSRSLNYPLIVGNNNGSFSAGALAITNSNNDSASYYDRFVLSAFDIAGTGAAPALVAGVSNVLNTWYHVAIVRNNTSLVMYRDGVAVASRTISASIVFNWAKLGLRVGGGNWDAAASYFNGYIDDLRMSRVARYTANFTPPSVALPRQ